MGIFTKEMNMNKLEKDGKVAVMISPGFGAGWSTWNSEFRDTLLFDAEIAQAVIDGDKAKAAQLAMEKCPGLYAGGAGGAGGLMVEWIDKGSAFEVEEHDGSESLHIIGSRDYSVV